MKNIFWIGWLFLVSLCRMSPCSAQTFSTIAGTGTPGYTGDGGPAIQAQLKTPRAICTDGSGNVYFIDFGNFVVRKIDLNGLISTFAGNGKLGFTLAAGPATQVSLGTAGDLAFAKNGTLYIVDGNIQTVTGGILTPDLASAALAITVDNNGIVYYAQSGAIYRYNPSALGTLVAGTLGQLGDDGDGGPALQAHFTIGPEGLKADSSGNLYITDVVAGRIRKFTPGGNIQTVAGTGSLGSTGDGGPATNAQISPLASVVDAAGNIYFVEGGSTAQFWAGRVRRVDTSGNISTVYVNQNQSIYFAPDSVAVDAGGNIYAGDSDANEIYKIAAASGGANPSFSQAGVVSAAGNVPGLTPGGWLTIYGQNLSGTTRGWMASDFHGQQLPTSLSGVSVMIDNRAAAVNYISQIQINVQVPDDSATGPVAVIVTNGQNVSAPVAVPMSTYAPSFFTVGKYALALHADNSLVGSPSLTPGATPATRGEEIVLYGTGFGPTSPATPSGLLVTSAYTLAALGQLSITIGGAPAQVIFAGVVEAGLDQFNVIVPNVPGGDQSISATIAGAAAQTGLLITVQQ